MPGLGINTSYIKGIKSAYKAKEGSKGCRMRGMTEYQEAEKEASRTGAALWSESRAGVAEEQPTRRTDKLCLSVPELLLPKISLAKRR